MSIRPFLSYKREDHARVVQLRRELEVRGAGGWKDTDDLPLGSPTPDVIREVIRRGTGGFILFGTKAALGSDFICGIEIPEALDRADREPGYPLVPVFVDLSPGRDRGMFVERLGLQNAERLLQRNGILHKPRQAVGELAVQTARRYVRSAVTGLPGERVTCWVSVFSEPSHQTELTFDWRPLFDSEARRLREGAQDVIRQALSDVRDAMDRRPMRATVELQLTTTLPIAFLIGAAWRLPTGLVLEVQQRTGATVSLVSGAGETDCARMERRSAILGGAGPWVVCATTRVRPDVAIQRYAQQVDAAGIVHLHVEGVLNNEEIRGLARSTAAELRVLSDSGAEKHLLIQGPEALALFTGAAANGTGSTTLPFWNGSGYANPIRVVA